jgi:hypothetical protein
LQKKPVLRAIVVMFMIAFLVVQAAESYIWVYLKVSPLPEQTSSIWILNNVPKGATIGLENIPLYQFEPDFVLKEFYQKLYNPKLRTRYNYSVIDSKTKQLPKFIVLSDVYFERKYLKVSDKNYLVARLKATGYRDIKDFYLKLPIYGNLDKNYYTPYFGLLAYPESISIFSK